MIVYGQIELSANVMRPDPINVATQAVEGNPSKADKRFPSDGGGAGGLREKEHAWCRTHVEELRKFSGQWVILEAERVVAHGKEPSSLLSQARRQGIKIPYIIYVGEANQDVAKLGL